MFNYKILPLLIALFFLSCTENTSDNSQAHQDAVKWTAEIRKIHEDYAEKLAILQKQNEKMQRQLSDTEQPDAVFTTMVKQHNTEIARFNGLLEKFESILLQHEEYIQKHENSALSSVEITAQHAQMKKDYELLQQDAKRAIVEIGYMLEKHASYSEDS